MTEATPAQNPAENDYTPIFDGRTLDGWHGDPRFWSVQNGAIVGETSAENSPEHNTFLIWEGGEPSDFSLRFVWRFVVVSPESYGNSGIQVRSERFAEPAPNAADPDRDGDVFRVRGYQPDMAISDWIPGILFEEGGRGILARRGEQVFIDAQSERHIERFAEEDELGAQIRLTDWNDYLVHAHGDTIRSYINGHLMHELIDRAPEARRQGILAYQLHTGPPMRIEIKEVYLKPLP